MTVADDTTIDAIWKPATAWTSDLRLLLLQHRLPGIPTSPSDLWGIPQGSEIAVNVFFLTYLGVSR